MVLSDYPRSRAYYGVFTQSLDWIRDRSIAAKKLGKDVEGLERGQRLSCEVAPME
jgi:hypothetical protein